MPLHVRILMIGMTLLFDIGIILFSLRTPSVPGAGRVLFCLLPWLFLTVCLIRWPRTRPSTQAWVGVLVLLVLFALVAGILRSL